MEKINNDRKKKSKKIIFSGQNRDFYLSMFYCWVLHKRRQPEDQNP